MNLPMPTEIPWKLAATTQKLKQDGGPEETTVALFYYEPKLENLERDYPDQRLIYLKYSVSISPCRATRKDFGKLIDHLPNEVKMNGLPVWHILFDLQVSPKPFKENVIHPYFHAASPMRREMIETGVVGNDFFEGESNGVSIGKSASQLHEAISSTVNTNSSLAEFQFGPFASYSEQSTSTAVESNRRVSQSIDSTTREAAQERRELLSHMTNVKNIFSLLTTKHVGSPYLRFSLWPRPLRTLSIDAGDPNLWYNQLIQRKSRGLEGVQEFITVVAVPKDEDFCLEAKLRRFCVLDNTPKLENSSYSYTKEDQTRLRNYLNLIYPRGTPIDELDIDIWGQLQSNGSTKAEDNPFPIVSTWFPPRNRSKKGVILWITSPGPLNKGYNMLIGSYKHVQTVWKEMLQYEYEAALTTSPLERGKVITKDTPLKTCFQTTEEGLEVELNMLPLEIQPSYSLSFLAQTPSSVRNQNGSRRSSSKFRQQSMAWNTIERQLAMYLSNFKEEWRESLKLEDARVVQVFFREWATLYADDPRNLPFTEAVELLQLNPHQQQRLKEEGVTDLRGIVRLLETAPKLAEHNLLLQEIETELDDAQREIFDTSKVEYTIADRTVDDLRTTISRNIGRFGRGTAGRS